MKTAYFLKKDITTSQDLSEDELDYTTTLTRKFKLESVMLKASVAISETITITKDSVNGSAYDTVLAKKTLSSAQSYVFRPQGEENFQAGDKLKIHSTNANGTGVLRATVKTSEI